MKCSMKCPECECKAVPTCQWCGSRLPKPPSIWHKPSDRPEVPEKLLARPLELIVVANGKAREGRWDPSVAKFVGPNMNAKRSEIIAWAYASDVAAWAAKEVEGTSDG